MVVPLTLAIVFLLLYLNSGSAVETAIVMLAVPFSLVGAFWLLCLLDYNLSRRGVGRHHRARRSRRRDRRRHAALPDLAWKERAPTTRAEASEAIVEGAAKRIRPKLMTVTTILRPRAGPLEHGTGADVMKRIAAPMVGGLVTSSLLELLVYPAIFAIWKGRHLPDGAPARP